MNTVAGIIKIRATIPWEERKLRPWSIFVLSDSPMETSLIEFNHFSVMCDILIPNKLENSYVIVCGSKIVYVWKFWMFFRLIKFEENWYLFNVYVLTILAHVLTIKRQKWLELNVEYNKINKRDMYKFLLYNSTILNYIGYIGPDPTKTQRRRITKIYTVPPKLVS